MKVLKKKIVYIDDNFVKHIFLFEYLITVYSLFSISPLFFLFLQFLLFNKIFYMMYHILRTLCLIYGIDIFYKVNKIFIIIIISNLVYVMF